MIQNNLPRINLTNGMFTVSLDCELFWGVRDHRTLTGYGENIRNVHRVVPRLLELFRQYDVHATWAVVGFLFFEDQSSLLKNIPQEKPSYANSRFDQYNYILQEELDPLYHFAPNLIKQIAATPNQEIATHTFSHYYCLERGQTAGQFKVDIEHALQAAKAMGVKLRSIVFPRNQYAEDYLQICRNLGIKTFRGTEQSWIWEARARGAARDEFLLRKAFRLIDNCIDISGQHTYNYLEIKSGLLNVPSSRFLSPYRPSLRFLDCLKLRRITRAMDCAAERKQLFHLWWHPHNFGTYMNENLLFLEKILQHYQKLRRLGRMDSKTMGEMHEMLSPERAIH